VAKIQGAIDGAATGDTVLVAPGTYFERLTFRGKALTVTGTAPWDPSVVAATVVDASTCFRDSCSVVRFNQREDARSVLAGLTLTAGRGIDISDDWRFDESTVGGGIYIAHSSPRIVGCVIRGNEVWSDSYWAGGAGGGVYCDASSPALEACVISDNHTNQDGAGIHCDNGSTPSLIDCTISDNTAGMSGGGLYADGTGSSPKLTDCGITDNTARQGGGIGFWSVSPRPTLTGCTITGNIATWNEGGGLLCSSTSPLLTACTIQGNWAEAGGALFSDWSAQPQMTHCILWDNGPSEIATDRGGGADITYSDVMGGWSGTGNIDADPRFCEGPCAQLADFSLAQDSPCLGSGQGGADMGAWGQGCALPREVVPALIEVPGDHPSIRAALAAACDRDTILVAPGSYVEPGLVVPPLDLVLRGWDPRDPDVVAATVIDGAGEQVIVLTPSLLRAPTLSGLTITGGGTGISCAQGQPLIDHCVITGNDAMDGGGLSARRSDFVVRNSIIRGNRARSEGAGLYFWGGAPSLANCVVADNSCDHGGGAFDCHDSEPLISNCVIANNIASNASVMAGSDTSPFFINCTITGNVDREQWDAAISGGPGPLTLVNCILSNDDAKEIKSWGADPVIRYSNVQGGWPGMGNIDQESELRSWQGFDYLLAPGSPCVDAGAPTIEDGVSDRHPRWPPWYPNGPRSDMGAYGGPGNADWF